jgi:hypothetical protein
MKLKLLSFVQKLLEWSKRVILKIDQQNSLIEPPTVPTVYPSGVAVSDGINTYFIKNGKKYRVISDRALESWGFSVWYGSPESLSKTVLGGILGFRDGTVIKDISNGKIYLVVNSKKQHITSPDVFTKFGIDIESILLVSHKEAELHKDGEPIN